MTQKDTHAMFANEMHDLNKVLDGGVTGKEIEYNTRN
jgi:hypothetical protein